MKYQKLLTEARDLALVLFDTKGWADSGRIVHQLIVALEAATQPVLPEEVEKEVEDLRGMVGHVPAWRQDVADFIVRLAAEKMDAMTGVRHFSAELDREIALRREDMKVRLCLKNQLARDEPLAELAREWAKCPGPTETAALKYLAQEQLK